MEIFVLTLVIFLLAAIGMALGTLITGVELKGTCAALTQVGFTGANCETCPFRRLRKDCGRRDTTRIRRASSSITTANEQRSSAP